MIRKSILAIALAFGFAGTASADTIVVNGSFEDVTLDDNRTWQLFDVLNGGWEATQDKIEIQSNATLGEIDAQNGTFYVELNGNGPSIFGQEIDLERGAHVLSFYYAPRGNRGERAGNVSVLGPLGVGDPLPVITSFDFKRGDGGSSRGNWTQFFVEFFAPSDDTYLLTFSATSSGSTGALVDNIRVAAVPEPATWLMMILGFAATAFAAKRRRVAAFA